MLFNSLFIKLIIVVVVVWHGVLCCAEVWCSAVRCCMAWCGAVWC